MNVRTKRRYLGIRIIVGLIVLGFLLARLDPADLFKSARQSSAWLLGVAFLFIAARLLIGAGRWRLACGELVQGVSFWQFYAWYMESSFFNIFVPSQGGDLVRVFRLAACKGDNALAISTVIAERVLGLVALILLAGTGLLAAKDGGLIPGIGVSFALVSAATVIALATLFHPALSRVLIRFFPKRKWDKTVEFVQRCTGVLAELAKRPGQLVGIVGYSLAMQLVGITAVYFTGLAISISVPFSFYLLMVPIIWLVVMVPVSLNGIGTREAANIALLGVVGVPAESALLLSIFWSAQLLLVGLIGGVFHLWLTATETKLKADEAVPYTLSVK